MLIGMAIRCGYGLGIDKLALKMFSEAERTLELERARLCWTCKWMTGTADIRLLPL
jgi:hypothetical protein